MFKQRSQQDKVQRTANVNPQKPATGAGAGAKPAGAGAKPQAQQQQKQQQGGFKPGAPAQKKPQR